MDAQRDPGGPEERARTRARHPPASAQAGQKDIDCEGNHPHAYEQGEAIGPVKALSKNWGPGFCDLVLLMLIVVVTVRLVTPTGKYPSHTASRQ